MHLARQTATGGSFYSPHDDAFIINTDTCASVALEPTYFDKTQDYPTGCEDNKYLLTVQNCSATLDEDGKVVLVTEDIRNGNGRAIKSKLWSPNRVDKIDEPVNAIFWIMKDPTIPPVVKLKGASLASVMGATLATKKKNKKTKNSLLLSLSRKSFVFSVIFK